MLGLGSFFQVCATKEKALQDFANKYSSLSATRPLKAPPSLAQAAAESQRDQAEHDKKELERTASRKLRKKKQKEDSESASPSFGSANMVPPKKTNELQPPPAPQSLAPATTVTTPVPSSTVTPEPQPEPQPEAAALASPPSTPPPQMRSVPAAAVPSKAKPARRASSLQETKKVTKPAEPSGGGMPLPPLQSKDDQEKLKQFREIESQKRGGRTVAAPEVEESKQDAMGAPAQIRDSEMLQKQAVTDHRRSAVTTKKTGRRDQPKQEQPPDMGGLAQKNSDKAESELRRKATVRYFKQMYPFCSFPLTVLFSQKKMRELVHHDMAQVEGNRDVVVAAVSPCVEIIPQLPGCIVVPERKKLDITPEISSVSFEVTPLAEGNFPRANIEICYQEQLLDTIMIPTRVTKQTIAKFAVYAGIASPIISVILDTLRIDLKQQLPVVVVWLSRLVKALGGATMFGILLAGVFAALAVLFYWYKRPQQADPVEVMLAID